MLRLMSHSLRHRSEAVKLDARTLVQSREAWREKLENLKRFILRYLKTLILLKIKVCWFSKFLTFTHFYLMLKTKILVAKSRGSSASRVAQKFSKIDKLPRISAGDKLF